MRFRVLIRSLFVYAIPFFPLLLTRTRDNLRDLELRRCRVDDHLQYQL